MTPVSSGPVYTTTKTARLRAMCVQMPGGTPLFYKATLPTRLACTLPHFQSLRLSPDLPFRSSNNCSSVQYHRVIVHPSRMRFSETERGPHNKYNEIICLTKRCPYCVLSRPVLFVGDKRGDNASATQNDV